MSDILTHFDAGVTTITLNRLDKKNSITGDMYAAMAKAIDDAQANSACRVLVIQGHESIFSAGNDIGDFLNKMTEKKFDGDVFSDTYPFYHPTDVMRAEGNPQHRSDFNVK